MARPRALALGIMLLLASIQAPLAPALGPSSPQPTAETDPAVDVIATAEGAEANVCSPSAESHQLAYMLLGPGVGVAGAAIEEGAEWAACQLAGTRGVNTTQTDANQTKLDIYQSAQNSKANYEVYNASLNNYLQDTLSIALMEGKNAYIRALNNQTSEAAATTAAKEQQDEYYSVKEYNLVNRWNNQIANLDYLRTKAIEEKGVPDWYISVLPDRELSDPGYYTSPGSPKEAYMNITGFGNTTFTLQNGTSVQVRTVDIQVGSYNPNYGPWTETVTVDTGAVAVDGVDGHSSYKYGFDEFVAFPPKPQDYNRVNITSLSSYERKLSKIDSQTSEAHTEVENFVANTYDQYIAGEINNSDLVDPYLAKREYSPGGSFQAWATTSLTLMGSNTPENIDEVGKFKVVTGSASYEGMLLSDENPTSGKFAAGNTYNPDTIGGEQMLVTDSRMLELTRNFTVANITNARGEQVRNVTVREVDYQTANTTEYNEVMQELAEIRTEVEAREQRRGGGGGGLFGGWGGAKAALGGSALGIVVGAGAVILILVGLLSGGGGGGMVIREVNNRRKGK
ncbi:hypothetical protein HZS55_09800 [Halosimplex rubrum]|uniref:Envelope protein N-terminal domain-containing protein n=1 Tax=Halosimplex rubrum TaxID=869889 RepID=A0A7D5TLJ6_9EURY|nr:hypothetical protein [Halosimplex rubrum]QLH77572.1 hypothetical protein HZS55_09800 [Halosimplex rubrum]